MKYCKFCGRQLADDALCNCPGAVSERESQVTVRSTQEPPSGSAPQPGGNPSWQPYQQPARPAGGAFTKSMKNLSQVLPAYVKNPKKATAVCKQANDLLLPLLSAGVLFLALLAANCCIFGKSASSVSTLTALINSSSSSSALYSMRMSGLDFVAKNVTFHFGFVLLAAFIETVVICALNVLGRFIIAAVSGAKPFNAKKCLSDAFISFGVHSLFVAALIILGGLGYLMTSVVGQIFFGLAAVWYICTALSELKDEMPDSANLMLRFTVVAVVALLCVLAYAVVYKLMFAMNTGMSVHEFSVLSKMAGSVNDMVSASSSGKLM